MQQYCRSTKINRLLNIEEYILRAKIIKDTPGGMDSNGFSYRYFNGKKISEKDFIKQHPPVKLIKDNFGKGENIGSSFLV